MEPIKPNMKESKGTNERFSSSKGFILAAIGSAVGLGNMWKFPYITGENGGAAFFLLFIACLVTVGLPVLLAELAIGRAGRGSASSSFVKAGGGKIWGKLGFISVIAPFLIMTFYILVAGWTLHYAVLSFTGQITSGTDFNALFSDFTGSYMPMVWAFISVILVALVVVKGVSGGIEKFNKVLIPGMLALLVILMIRAVTLPGAMEGVEFFLSPDFSKLTPEAGLVALGHAFFSLSLGMGTMITYGAFVDRNQSLGSATLAVGVGDLVYAFIAGLIIFPTTFAFGINPSSGPGLVFVALPAAFSAMPLGWLFGGLFFILLAIAALTSLVSLLQVPVTHAMEKWNWSRNKAVWIISLLVFVVSIPSALSMGLVDINIGENSFFDFVDTFASNWLLPLGGLVVTLFAGYFWKKAAEGAGLTATWFRIWLFMIRYVAPILIIFVFLYSTGILNLE